MATFITTCPHCNTKQIALKVISAFGSGSGDPVAYLICPNCSLPSCAILYGNRDHLYQFSQQDGTLNSKNYELKTIWPEPLKPLIPDFIPTDVKRALLQAESNFVQENHQEAAAVMYRKALESSLKLIAPELKGTLASRIIALGKSGRLTSDLVEWSKEIKNLGNDGAHEVDGITTSEVRSLRGLTEMVLRYLFTLPKTIEEMRKSRIESDPKT